jgi:transposase
MQAKFVAHVRAGNFIETVCAACGIAVSTYYTWAERAENGEEPYAGFMEAVRTAEAEAELEAVEGILTHAAENWSAFSWYLERRHWKRWRKTDKVEQEVTVKKEGPEPSELDDEIRRILNRD